MPAVLALAAAALIGAGLSLQHRAANAEDAHAVMDPRLVFRLLRRKTWLLGIGVGFTGFLCQAIAIGSGRLVVVEPIVATNVLFALLVSARYARRRLGRREWRGIVATVVGVSGFLVVAAPSEPANPEAVVPWAVPLGALALVVVAGVGLSRRLAPAHRGLLLAGLAGLSFGTGSALIKLISEVADGGGAGDVFGHWGLYAWLVLSPTAFLLQQSALHATHLGAALPATSTLGPTMAAVLGAVMFGEQIRGGWAVPAEVVLVALMLVGVAGLASSPLIEADVDPLEPLDPIPPPAIT